MSVTIHHGRLEDVLPTLTADSIDAFVGDPPYELSQDGQASAARVFSKLVLPNHPQLNSTLSEDCELSLLVSKIARLGLVDFQPTPPSAVPICSVALNGDVSGRNEGIENVDKPSGCVADDDSRLNCDPKAHEHFGCFALKLADPITLIDTVNRVGACFVSGTVGIGTCIDPASIPSLLHGLASIINTDDEVRFGDDAFSLFVGARCRAKTDTMACLSPLRGASYDRLSAMSALILLAVFNKAGAKLVRTDSAAGGLPTMLQPRRISVIDSLTNGAFSFDLIIHPQAIISTGFMGNGWDGSKVAFNVNTWRQIFRVLKPGAHLLAFSGTRTYHRMVCAVEDAGFEIRDQLAWCFGSGFPKSLNLDGEWDGWGTALKPGWEPICLARKPLIGTVEQNIATYRTGALNIDGCRIGDFTDNGAAHSLGRWPANICHDGSDEVRGVFPEAGGQQGDLNGQSGERKSRGIFGDMPAPRVALARNETDTSAARFFYCAKASNEDREHGCADLPERQCDESRKEDNPGGDNPRNRGLRMRKNSHPTVKPTALMRWLCRLITPPGGTVLDSFMGSGSTGRAAVLEGFNFIGIEMTDEYLPIARARIAAAEKQKANEDEEKRLAGIQGNLPL